jgi:hypothetical protein
MGPHADARGPAFGLAISLLVHAGVLAWLMHLAAPALRPAGEAPAARMQVRLEPARPARPAQPEASAAPVAAEAAAPAAHRSAAPARPAPRRQPHPRAQAQAPASARPSARPPLIAAPAASAPDVFAVPPNTPSTPAAGPDAGPVVDLEAARQAARRIAHEDSRNLVRLPARKPVVNPNQDHQVEDPLERARRSDCKTAYAGLGILALIPLAKDAITGSGCKW